MGGMVKIYLILSVFKWKWTKVVNQITTRWSSLIGFSSLQKNTQVQDSKSNETFQLDSEKNPIWRNKAAVVWLLCRSWRCIGWRRDVCYLTRWRRKYWRQTSRVSATVGTSKHHLLTFSILIYAPELFETAKTNYKRQRNFILKWQDIAH